MEFPVYKKLTYVCGEETETIYWKIEEGKATGLRFLNRKEDNILVECSKMDMSKGFVNGFMEESFKGDIEEITEDEYMRVVNSMNYVKDLMKIKELKL